MTAGLLLLAGLTAACASPEPPRPMQISARTTGAALDVTLANIPTGREIVALVLVDPHGGETPASEGHLVTREEGGDSFSGPGVSVEASGGSSSRVRSSVSLGYLFRGKNPERRTRRLVAVIPLPDPAAYAAGYRDWAIEARYRDELGALQQRRIPAPPPTLQ